ncbi:MAG: YeiH family protein [Bdellovibrio sp.]
MKEKLAKILIPVAALVCLIPLVGSATALLTGVILAVFLGNPYLEHTRKLTHKLLTWSVVGLGAGMNLETVARVGFQGLGYTMTSIAFVLVLGFLLVKLLKIEKETGLLITVGTAICGGSAIAAVTPVLRAKHHNVSVALGTVFILNAMALVVFPPIGHYLHLSQEQFGLWSALAIHDTSSVVGATVSYGAQAAEIGTTVKLARALWIVPLAFAIGFVVNRKNQNTGEAGKAKKPWFILGFLIAAAIVTWVPQLKPTGGIVEMVAKRTLVVTLFLIGAGLSKETLKQVGVRPFVLGVLLWIITGVSTLSAIEAGWIH